LLKVVALKIGKQGDKKMQEWVYGCAAIASATVILLAIGEPSIELGGAVSLIVGIILGCTRHRSKPSVVVPIRGPKDAKVPKKTVPKAA
jgi:hypothetical protein